MGHITRATPTTRYHLYGLVLESEFELPEVRPASGAAARDARVRIGTVDAGGLTEGRQLGPHLWAAPGALWLRVPNVARFLVTGGSEIVVDPHPGVDDDSVRVFLLSSALGALLSQRGMVVLHGTAIRVGDGCAVCVGASGAGKSTVAAELIRRGHPILADDVVPVDDECRALAGFPRLKLWQDAADRLDIDTTDLRTIRPSVAKFNYPLGDAEFSSEALPVRRIYVLAPRHHGGQLGVEPVQGMNRLTPLLRNTYRFRYLGGLGLQPEHLRGCARLAGRAGISILTRPAYGVEPSEVADLLLADLEAHT